MPRISRHSDWNPYQTVESVTWSMDANFCSSLIGDWEWVGARRNLRSASRNCDREPHLVHNSRNSEPPGIQ